MKKIINLKYTLGMFFAVCVLFSCEQNEFPVFGEEAGQQYVAFENDSDGFSESALVSAADGSSNNLVNNTYEVRLVRSALDISNELTVAVDYTAVYAADTDFGAAGEDASDRISIKADLSAITFEANKAYTSFIVESTENLETQGDIVVNFTIQSVSDSKYQIGYQSGNVRSSTTLTVIDDDCPIDLVADWEGIYEVQEFPAAPGSFNEGFSVSAAVGLRVLVEADPSDPLGVSVVLKPAPENPLLVDDVPLQFITCPETVLIGSGFYTLAFNQNGAPAAMGRSDEPGIYGNGTFSPDGSGLTIVVEYGNVNIGLVFDEFLLVLKRVEE